MNNDESLIPLALCCSLLHGMANNRPLLGSCCPLHWRRHRNRRRAAFGLARNQLSRDKRTPQRAVQARLIDSRSIEVISNWKTLFRDQGLAYGAKLTPASFFVAHSFSPSLCCLVTIWPKIVEFQKEIDSLLRYLNRARTIRIPCRARLRVDLRLHVLQR